MAIPSPVKAHCVHSAVQTQTNKIKDELFECNNDDDYISYSPLSELQDVDEEHRMQKNKKERLFHSTALQEDVKKVDDDSLKLFSDEDDDLFFGMLGQYETGNREHGSDKNVLDCEKLQTSLAPDNHLTISSSTGVSDFKQRAQSMGKHATSNNEGPNSVLQSPQSLVLEHLRDRISKPACVNSLASPYEEVNATFINQELSSTQTDISITQKTLSMASRRTQNKTGPSGLKQTDIVNRK